MTEQEAIDDTLKMIQPYLAHELTDAQAARIGRHLYANLRQAERDKKRAQENDRVSGLQWRKS